MRKYKSFTLNFQSRRISGKVKTVTRTGKSVGFDFGLQKSFTNHDFHFKLARQLCLEYETICIEDLNIKGMQRLYGKKIGDLAFSEFVNILKYTATKFDVLRI